PFPMHRSRLMGALVLTLAAGLAGPGIASASPGASAPLRIQQTPAVQGSISGRVIDGATGQPLSAASVVVVGTDRGGLTDSEGRFVIPNVPAGTHTVRVSLIGYAPGEQQVQVTSGGATTADFQLDAAAITLDEIVAVGYGTQRRGDLTSAVTAVG